MSEKTASTKKKASSKKKETASPTPPAEGLSLAASSAETAVPSAQTPAADDSIFIKGARMHNLKNVDVAIPRNKLVVVTGVSGSGKSSLTMDTLFAEGQRRYAESLSAYARQFLARMDKPDVDYIRGICPAIAIEQKVTSRTPRSTVGSMTEIGDYLRLLFARVGRTYSPVSGEEVRKDTVSDVVTAIQNLPHGTRVFILAPLFTRYGRSLAEELKILLQKGFTRVYNPKTGAVRIEDLLPGLPLAPSEGGGGETYEKAGEEGEKIAAEPTVLSEETTTFWLTEKKAAKATKTAKPMWQKDAYLLLDRLVVKDFDEDDLHRLADSVQTAFYESDGDCFVEWHKPAPPPAPSEGGGDVNNIKQDGVSAPSPSGRAGEGLHHFNSRFERDDITFEEPSPNLFSPNNPIGACPTCEGFGMILGIDPDLVLPDKRLSVYEGAVAPWKGEKMGLWKDDFVRQAARMDFPVHKPVMDLTPEEYQLLWDGGGRIQGIRDFFRMVSENLYKIQYRIMQARYRGRTLCTDCGGSRLRKEALYVKVSGSTIADLLKLPVSDLAHWFERISLSETEAQIAKRILLEISQRIKTLLDVGLNYLTLSRTANTLSGGESQRIQLTKFLGSNLTDSLYILDEPSIGLHPRDTARLIGVLKNLRDLGNTVVVVEHDEMMMREADHIIDMGPLASYLGGEVVAEGDYAAIVSNPQSLTGKYLSGALQIEVPSAKRKASGALRLEGARQHNLKDISVDIPLGVLTVVSGISGSGKTTLIKGTLFPALQKYFGTGTDRPGLHRSLTGDLDKIDGVELVDQNPIGKSSRSNPVTYVKAWDEIRKLFEKQPLSKMRGYEGRHFSFNTDGGRCDTCKGEGSVVVEMQFLADVHLLCESCKGQRFKEEVLEVTYGTKNVFEVLEMSVDEALDFFRDEKKIVRALKPLSDVGLGYIKLGQSSDTLSGGEAQRVKLATFLGQGASKQKVLFIFDEPTTGLHFNDIKKLLQSFSALLDEGHSILVVEHNTDVIKSADYVIDLGPEGGEGGGYLIYEGAPEGLKAVAESATGKYL